MTDLTGLSSVFDFGSKVLDKLFPDKTVAEEQKAKLLQLAQQGELDMLAAEMKDRADARALADKDIAGGNNFTRFLAATVRPVWGYWSLFIVTYSIVQNVPMQPAIQSIIETVLYFYFGGRTVEKITPIIASAFKK